MRVSLSAQNRQIFLRRKRRRFRAAAFFFEDTTAIYATLLPRTESSQAFPEPLERNIIVLKRRGEIHLLPCPCGSRRCTLRTRARARALRALLTPPRHKLD